MMFVTVSFDVCGLNKEVSNIFPYRGRINQEISFHSIEFLAKVIIIVTGNGFFELLTSNVIKVKYNWLDFINDRLD